MTRKMSDLESVAAIYATETNPLNRLLARTAMLLLIQGSLAKIEKAVLHKEALQGGFYNCCTLKDLGYDKQLIDLLKQLGISLLSNIKTLKKQLNIAKWISLGITGTAALIYVLLLIL